MEVITVDSLDSTLVRKTNSTLRRCILAAYGHVCPSKEEFDEAVSDEMVGGIVDGIKDFYSFLGDDAVVNVTKEDLYDAYFKKIWLASDRSKVCGKR